MTGNVIDGLFIITLIGLLVLIVMLIVMIYRAHHVLNNWAKVSDTLSDSMTRLIPAVVNMATIGKGIHTVQETIADHKKKSAEKN
jgi:hypothetical protein